MFGFCLSLLHIFRYATIMSFICSMQLRFLMMLQLRYFLVGSNYVRKFRYKMDMF